MPNELFDELKAIKSKLTEVEKATKKVEDKKEREARLQNEFEAYMKETGVKKG
jgi:hypothetical protein